MKRPSEELLKLSREELAKKFAKAMAKPMTPEEEQAELDKLPKMPEGDTHGIFYNRNK